MPPAPGLRPGSRLADLRAAGPPPAGLPPAGLPPAGLPPAGPPPAGLRRQVGGARGHVLVRFVVCVRVISGVQLVIPVQFVIAGRLVGCAQAGAAGILVRTVTKITSGRSSRELILGVALTWRPQPPERGDATRKVVPDRRGDNVDIRPPRAVLGVVIPNPERARDHDRVALVQGEPGILRHPAEALHADK